MSRKTQLEQSLAMSLMMASMSLGDLAFDSPSGQRISSGKPSYSEAQVSDPARVERLKAQAEERRQQRAAKLNESTR